MLNDNEALAVGLGAGAALVVGLCAAAMCARASFCQPQQAARAMSEWERGRRASTRLALARSPMEDTENPAGGGQLQPSAMTTPRTYERQYTKRFTCASAAASPDSVKQSVARLDDRDDGSNKQHQLVEWSVSPTETSSTAGLQPCATHEVVSATDPASAVVEASQSQSAERSLDLLRSDSEIIAERYTAAHEAATAEARAAQASAPASPGLQLQVDGSTWASSASQEQQWRNACRMAMQQHRRNSRRRSSLLATLGEAGQGPRATRGPLTSRRINELRATLQERATSEGVPRTTTAIEIDVHEALPPGDHQGCATTEVCATTAPVWGVHHASSTSTRGSCVSAAGRKKPSCSAADDPERPSEPCSRREGSITRSIGELSALRRMSGVLTGGMHRKESSALSVRERTTRRRGSLQRGDTCADLLCSREGPGRMTGRMTGRSRRSTAQSSACSVAGFSPGLGRGSSSVGSFAAARDTAASVSSVQLPRMESTSEDAGSSSVTQPV